jgi:hypothetical protein
MSQEIYAIIDLPGYASQMREAAAKSLSDSNEENLDDFISIGQIISMVKQECLGFDNENRPMLDEDTNEKIYEDTAIWIHNVGLAKLAAQDLVECAWDDEYNDMVFWAKEKTKNAKPKPKRRRNKKNTE